MKPEIAKALPKSGITADRFVRIVQSSISKTPKLQECSPESFLGAMMTAAQLGIEPDSALGQGYILPYDTKQGMKAQFQLGYTGHINLAYRSDQVTNIQAHAVHENDEFSVEYSLHPDIRHIPCYDRDRGPVKLYYAAWTGLNGTFGYSVRTLDEIKRHRDKYSKSANKEKGPWLTAFDAMAKKTVIKEALKTAPLVTELMRGVNADESVRSITSDQADDVLDRPNDEVIYEVETE